MPRWRAENAGKIAAALEWCERHKASFRIVTEREIETPYLRNARRLRPAVGGYPDVEILSALRSLIGEGEAEVGDLVAELAREGLPEPEVRDAIDVAVANRLLAYDLARLYDDRAILARADPRGREYNDRDPIIRMLVRADSA